MLKTAVIAISLCSASLAQQGPANVYRIGAGVAAPVLLSRQEPEYSEEARKAKLQGSVMLALVVSEEGLARDIRVVRSLGLGLDENAVAAVSKWRFQPGTKDGQPVAVQTQIEVSYRLLMGPADWSLAHVQFTAPPGAIQPRIERAPYGKSSGLPGNATARVSFDIDAQGVPLNIQVEQSSDPQWNDEVIALIREWRFQAALNSGTAIESHALFDLTRGLAPMPAQPPMKKR